MKCETQFDILRESVETYIWTFRWLWLINIAAVVWGIYSRHMDIVAFGAVSALVAIVGVARTRRGRRLVERAENVCMPPRPEAAQPEA
jgi:hypothetical protein